MRMIKTSDKLKEISDYLTNSERKVADVLLENYPLSGLDNITVLAEKSCVSTPTITRLVDKLGFSGYAHFQKSLKQELDDKLSRNILGGEPLSTSTDKTHVLNRITDSVLANVRETLNSIDVTSFDAMCDLLSDLDRNIYIVGGRVTGSLADHLYGYMQGLRPNSNIINGSNVHWQYNLIDMKKGDILFIYDISRYENQLLTIANTAIGIGTQVILVTDIMQSPIAKVATHTLGLSVSLPNGRMSLLSVLLLNEVIISQLQNNFGEFSQERWQYLDQMLQNASFFHK